MSSARDVLAIEITFTGRCFSINYMIFWTNREEDFTKFKWIRGPLHSAIHSALHILRMLTPLSNRTSIDATSWLTTPATIFIDTLAVLDDCWINNCFSPHEPSSATAILHQSIAVAVVVHTFRPSLLWRWQEYDCLLRVEGRLPTSHLGMGRSTVDRLRDNTMIKLFLKRLEDGVRFCYDCKAIGQTLKAQMKFWRVGHWNHSALETLIECNTVDHWTR